eukprot:scaffold6282_cov119-Isochrysis_galbana.AAC.8
MASVDVRSTLNARCCASPAAEVVTTSRIAPLARKKSLTSSHAATPCCSPERGLIRTSRRREPRRGRPAARDTSSTARSASAAPSKRTQRLRRRRCVSDPQQPPSASGLGAACKVSRPSVADTPIRSSSRTV